MNESPANEKSMPRFDDMIDTSTRISNLEVIRLTYRALRFAMAEKRLLMAKVALATFALIPAFCTPFLAKILIDQVILQKPFGETEIPFPPYIQAFIDLISGFSPIEIMIALTAVGFLFLLVFGRFGISVSLSTGEDTATQSEEALNRGESAGNGLVGIVEMLTQVRLSQRLSNRLRTLLFQRMTRLPMTTLDNHRIGDALYRVLYDTPQLPQVAYVLLVGPVTIVLTLVTSLYLINYSYETVAPEIVWASLAMVPLGLIATCVFSGLLRNVEQDSRAAGSATTNFIEESMGNISAVQSLGAMDYERANFEEKSKESFRRFRLVELVGIAIVVAIILVVVCVAIWLVILITNRIIAGEMSPGDFGTLLGLAIELIASTLGVATFWILLQVPAAALRRVYFFIDYPIEDSAMDQPLADLASEGFRFEGVSHTYDDGRRALNDVNLNLRRGEFVAFVGPTGAGKTSLAYMLPAYILPTSGRLLVDGVDINEVSTIALREQVTYVFQEHQLLSESIRENLVLAKPDATEQEMWNALDRAQVGDFVRQLPDELDTELGRSADTLSVGQKQRLSIARGLLRDTPVLVLDEPTAALDPRTENALVDGLRESIADKLVVIIAHRLSTIRRADRIVFLEDGEIRDVGSHDELLQNVHGPYRRYVEMQSVS